MPPTLYLPAWGRYGRTTVEWDSLAGTWLPVALPQDHRNELDVRLETAWEVYKDAPCPRCGVAWWYGRSTDNRIQFEIEEDVCYSCAELEAYRKNHKTSPGATEIAVPVGDKNADGSRDPVPSALELLGYEE